MTINPGTEIDVIDGVRWFILNVVDGTTANMGGTLAGMGELRLPIVSAVTAYDHETKGQSSLVVDKLLGITDISRQNVSSIHTL